MTVPQCVVGYDVAAGAHQRQQDVVIFEVLPLVGVHEGQVELSGLESAHHLQGVADVEGDFAGYLLRSVGEAQADEVFQFVVGLDGVQDGASGHALGDTQRGIAGEGAEFQRRHGANHFHQHLEQAPLHGAGAHTAVEQTQVGAPVQCPQPFRFGRGVQLQV